MVSENIPVGQLGCMGAGGAICTYYYLHDGLGSTMALVDSTGAVKNTYSYDPWGNSTGVTGNAPNPFRYVGAMLDSTGLRKMGERYYDPSIGRFTQLDPAGGRYGYVDGNPVNFVDPSGLGKHHKKAKKHKPKSVVFLPPTATPTPYIPMFPTYYPTPPPGPQEHAPTPPPNEYAAPRFDYRTSICATYGLTLDKADAEGLDRPPPSSTTDLFGLGVFEELFYPYYCVGH